MGQRLADRLTVDGSEPAKRKIWLVSGCSSGIGRATARAALAHGHSVVLASREERDVASLVVDYPRQASSVRLDLHDAASCERSVEFAIETHGHLDVLISCAGTGLIGAVEETNDAELRRVFDVNVFGQVALIAAALPMFRRRRSGQIVLVTSLAAVTAPPFAGIYGASKAAADSIAMSLAEEVAPFGISVCSLMPGLFRTSLRDSGLPSTDRRIADYSSASESVRAAVKSPYPSTAGDPAHAADVILQLVELGMMAPRRLLLGADALALAGRQRRRTADEAIRWEELSLAGERD